MFLLGEASKIVGRESSLSFALSPSERGFLVKLARRAITTYLRSHTFATRPSDAPKKLLQKCGVFVTLHRLIGNEKELRGCIGYPRPARPLVDATIDSAISAATRDPRFPSVTLNEMESITVEISVLTPPQLIQVKDPRDYPKRITVGQDGLIIEKGAYSGLLLPQVPVEQKWDSEEFLCNCCLKAWLPPDEWLSPDTKVYRFQAIVFGEETPNGKISKRELGC